ncbi:MAG: sulfite exporter TauE/SafE family protein [Pyrinomonadaceae bacterium]|nr:sulfite exporter TauE/SafE family protein [Acidobacteriota bacterium]MBK7932190.1 sulfite exporter TauE/SafE family protein [Acidobacteriota bacterium]MBP7475813.1 sulfite exporter TauE/SafE family protein [Pyrinomonadaceae bacterium]
MPTYELILLILVFLATSFVGVVTGSNSLIAVPVMFQVGVDPKVAVATNMFGLVFMSIGGTIPFLRKGSIDMRKISPLLVLTLISSAIGAALVGLISNTSIKLIVSIAMILVAVFILLKRDSGVDQLEPISRRSLVVTFILTFLLGIYGGIFSGGYVTILTAVLVAFFGMQFTEAVASTKLINVVSSAIATAVFMWQGLVDYSLGIVLGVTMFAGAYLGAHYATKLNDMWLKRIFLTTVFVLAIKTIYDFI